MFIPVGGFLQKQSIKSIIKVVLEVLRQEKGTEPEQVCRLAIPICLHLFLILRWVQACGVGLIVIEYIHALCAEIP